MKQIKLLATLFLFIITVMNVKAQAQLTKFINKADLDKIFALSHGNKVIMQIIPVKETGDIHKNDISINAYFFDMSGNLIWPGNGGLANGFVKASANYIKYIRATRKPGNLITYSYHITLTKQALEGGSGIEIHISPYNYKTDAVIISAKKSTDTAMMHKKCKPDTGFKCPPACSVFYRKYQTLLRDQLKN